jgi:thymidylate synthase
MNKLDKQYQQLLQDIIDFGVEKKDRTGTGTKSIFGYTIRHKMSDGFPLLTTKKMAWKTMVTELLWFLRGDTNIKYLVDNGCHIWDGDAYKNYVNKTNEDFIKSDITLPPSYYPMDKEVFINKIKTDNEFANKWGDLGPIYGAQWRNWIRKTTRDEKIVEPGVYETSIDQIQNLINDLKTNPDSRRMMVNAWNVGELDQMVLPPCHYGFQVYTRELSRVERVDDYNSKFENKIEVPFIKVNLGDAIENTIDTSLTQANIPTRAISLMWNQRSVDTFLGLPFNISSYGLLLMMIADEVGMVPDELIGNLGDTHIYLNHIEQAKEQIGREPMELPTVHIRDGIFCSSVNDVILENYNSHPSIKAPLSN